MPADQQLAKSLKPRHLSMIAIAGVIGAGLFVGSGAAIQQAGPGILVAYMAAGVVVILVMRMLGPDATLYGDDALAHGLWQDYFLNQYQVRIGGGTDEIMRRIACIKSASALRRNVAIFTGGCRRSTLPRIVRHALQVFREKRGEAGWLCLQWPFASHFLLLSLRPLSSAQHFGFWGCTGPRKNALVLSGRRCRGSVREGMA